jgi:hypothetical protein
MHQVQDMVYLNGFSFQARGEHEKYLLTMHVPEGCTT